MKKKSTEEFSCVPYIVALMNCLLYTWYGLPIVSKGWENFPVVTINGLGILLELLFIFIYFWFASSKEKVSFCQLTPFLQSRLINILFSIFLFRKMNEFVCSKLFIQFCNLGIYFSAYVILIIFNLVTLIASECSKYGWKFIEEEKVDLRQEIKI